MEFDEKELRREISYAIKNIHGIRHVLGPGMGSAFQKVGGECGGLVQGFKE